MYAKCHSAKWFLSKNHEAIPSQADHAKLVDFQQQKQYLTTLKPSNLVQFLPLCKHGIKYATFA